MIKMRKYNLEAKYDNMLRIERLKKKEKKRKTDWEILDEKLRDEMWKQINNKI